MSMLPDELLDLRLEVHHHAEGVFHVVATLGTERAEGTFTCSIRRDDVRSAIFQSDAASTAAVGRRSTSASSDPLRGLGTQLFARVFEGPATRIYQLTRPRGDGRPMALRLGIFAKDPASFDLPWEFLYDTRAEGFLALMPGISIVRLTPRTRAETPSPALRVALIVLDASDGLGARGEEEALQRIASSNTNFTVTRVDGLSLDALPAALAGIDVLHYIGFGNGKVDQPAISAGTGAPVRAHQLMALLPDSLRVVYLSADATDCFASALSATVGTTIGIRGTIANDAAVTLCETFYRSVLEARAVDDAFALARRAVAAAHPAARGWGLPLLFSHAAGIPLLQVQRPTSGGSAPETPVTELGSADEVLAVVRAMNIEALMARIDALGSAAPRFLHDQLDLERTLGPGAATEVE